MTNTTTEIDQLRGFALLAFDFLNDLVADPARAAALREGRTSIVDSRSVAGLRQLATDMVEWSQDLSQAAVQDLDQRLRHAGLPTLTRMRDARHRRLVGILARRRIKTDEEWHMVTALLADTASPELSSADRTLAEQLVAEYSGGAGGRTTSA